MTNARSNALSLAVAVAISSSIISTQALAERKLHIKSVDVSGNGHVEFIQSEVILKPTLGDDQEPIPKSFTTTYPDLTQARADYLVPSNGFTEVLSFIDGAVSSVDLFETDENGAAQRYTKVLKVGGEGIFRFTHNLEEEELVIEVRGGMTDQDSVKAVRDQITFSDLFLEPLTKIASPAQLYRLLQGADDRAGNLGTSDHYVALATIEVDKVEVSGRTFMRLISGRDQPPELKRLGQSLFVNDEVLLAAATSAYVQVHVLKGNLQQEALNKLLSYHKPVGYVVHIEGNRQTYPVPTGYPKLEVTEAPGEIIVFHGQKQNSADIAFVETLYTLWQEAEGNNPALAVTTKVKNLKIESYHYAIRSRQMAMLEEWDARYEAGEAVIGENEARKRAQEDQMVMFSLDFYESLQQALTSATPTDYVHEFEFSLEHIRVASLFITPIWLQVQLAKHFSFKPVIKGLLTHPHFIRSILSIIPVSSELQTEFLYKNEEFANQVLSDMARQLIEIESTQEELQIKEAKIIQLKNQLRLTVDKATASEKKKLRAQQIRLHVEDELAQLRNIHEVLHSQTQTLQQETQRIPALEQKIRDARKESRKVYNSELAIQLGIDDWDDTQPLDEQARRLSEKINDMNRAVAATFTAAGLLDEEAVKAKLAAIEGQFDINPLNEDDPGARSRSIQQHLHYRAELVGEEAPHRLAIIESLLGLVSDDEAHPKARRQAIQQHLKQLEVQLVQQRIQQLSPPTEAEKADTTKDRLALIASHLNIKEFDGNADIDVQQNLLLWRIESLNAQVQKAQCCRDDTIVKVMTSALAAIVGIKLNEDTTEEDINALMEVIHDRFQRLEDTEELLSDIRTPGHPISKPKVLDKLRAVEKALKMDNLDSEDDEYYRRHAISKEIQAYITKARERAEEEALDILEAVEETLGINIKEGDDKAARLDRVRTILDGNDVTEKKLDDIQYTLWEEEIDFDEDRDTKLDNLRARLTSEVEDTNERAREQQEYFLGAIEYRLGIDTSKNVAAKKRGRDFVAKVADDLKVKFKQDAGLDEQKYVLQSRIRALKYELDQTYNDLYDDESIIETKYNEIAHLLGVQNFIDDGTSDVQFNLITEKLQQLYEKVFKAGQPEVHERIAAIENELDRQMAHLGPKPRYVLDRELARARGNIEEAESELDELHRKLGAVHRQQVVFADSTNIDPETGKDKTTPNQVMKKLQTELGLTPVDKQTTGERVNDIRLFLQSAGSEKHDEIVQKLRAATSELKISVEGNAERLAEEDYFDAIITYTDTHGQDDVEHAMGELPETRKKYAQVTKFLHEHALKEMELTGALDEEKQAREELNTKNQAMHPSKEIDPKTKTKLEHNRQVLDLVLKQKKTKILKAQKAMMAHKKDLKAIEDDMGIKPDPIARYADRVDALRKKQIEMGGLDGTGGKILQLTREQDSLNREIEVRKGEIEQLKGVLKAAEEAVENEGGSFQYTPRQANILADIYAYGQSHSLKKQALEAAIGLAESAELSGKLIPNLHTFDLDDEFAPIRLQALAGNHLGFDQARRIVEVFKNLKTAFTIEPAEGQCLNPLGEVQNLADWARTHIKTGPQQYDDEIRGMGAAALHYVVHEPEDLKSFPEYFAAHSASGNRIIALLREGLISQVELEHYIKAVRGVDGYRLVDEFEHFLGYKHGVRVPEFRKVVQTLSDKGAEEFMQIAFTPVTMTTNGPAGMKESVAGMKEYAAALIANYVLDDVAFENGRRTLTFLTHVQDTLAPYAHAVGLSESDLIEIIHGTLMQAHAAAVEQQFHDYWTKPSAFLVQAVTWYFSSYKPLLVTHTALEAAQLSFSNMALLYLLDLTNRGDYLHRILTPFQHWLERYSVDLDRTRQYAYHSGIEQVAEVRGLAMPFGKAASSVILLKTGSMLFNRQYNANPRMYRTLSRLVPEMVKSMGSGQGVQVPLLHRVTPQKVKTLASATAGLVLGPVATVGAYTHGLISGFTYAQTFGFALASSLTFDFFMNDNKILTQWLGGPLGRSLDKLNRWRGAGETESDYVKRTAIATPQRFGETDEEYANRVKVNHMMHGWTRKENYLQFRERRDRTMKMYENGWERYFRDNVPKWSFSHAESIPYSYTLGAFYE